MRRFYLAGLFSGFIGGLLAAYVLAHVGRVMTGGNVSAGPIAAQQQVLSAQRIQLIDSTGKTRAELAMSRDGGPGSFFTIRREETGSSSDCIHRRRVNIHS